ncbi:MAG: hypothetical protein P8107_14325, partial [Spirochaetia bacterium]
YTRIGDLSKNDYGTFEDMADYLEFTALHKFRLQNKSTCFNAFAGPDFLWNITGKGNITVYDNDHNKRLSMDISEDSINRWLIGIAMGFGFDIDFTGIVLSFDVRYVAPLQEIYNNNLTYHDYVMENIQFLLGIGFKLF